jgi:hypothetical protein
LLGSHLDRGLEGFLLLGLEHVGDSNGCLRVVRHKIFLVLRFLRCFKISLSSRRGLGLEFAGFISDRKDLFSVYGATLGL